MDNFVDDGDANNDVVDIWNRALTKIMFHDTGFAWWLKQLVESEFGVTLEISEDDAHDILLRQISCSDESFASVRWCFTDPSN